VRHLSNDEDRPLKRRDKYFKKVRGRTIAGILEALSLNKRPGKTTRHVEENGGRGKRALKGPGHPYQENNVQLW